MNQRELEYLREAARVRDLHRSAFLGLDALGNNEALIRQLRETQLVGAQALSAVSKVIQDTRLSFDGAAARTAQIIAGSLVGTHSDAVARVVRDLASQQSALKVLFDEQRSIAVQTLAAAHSSVLHDSLKVISNSLASLNLYDTHPFLSARLLGPTLSYGKFASRTIERVDKAKDEKEERALEGSLLLAEEQITQTTAVIESLIVVPKDADQEGLPVEYNLFDVQQQELLGRETIPDDATTSDIAGLSPAVRIYEMTRCFRDLYLFSNQTSEQKSRGEVFNITTKVALILIGITQTVVTNEQELTSFINNLNILMYEAAGKNKTRFTKLKAVSGEECKIVDAITDLRNKYISHDLDQEREQVRQIHWAQLDDTLKWLGVQRLPYRLQEYRDLQCVLLERLISFLTLFVERISE